MAESRSDALDTEGLSSLLSEGDVRVLHVDDEPALLDLASTFLDREGISVTTAASPAAARDRLESEAVDCVVSDYDMPGKSGLEFLRWVRGEFPELPFILFTGKGSEEIASEAISAGVTDYLQKETGTEQYSVLANRIENVVERRRAEQLVEYSFRAIETAREGISLLDGDGRFVYVNEAYADIVGYRREELVGESWETLYPDADIQMAREEILSTVRREGYWEGENAYLRKDGSKVQVDHALASAKEGVLICLIRVAD